MPDIGSFLADGGVKALDVSTSFPVTQSYANLELLILARMWRHTPSSLLEESSSH